MKTGIILHIVGFKEADEKVNHEREIEELNLKADSIVFTSPTMGYEDIYSAWLELTTKGMGEIILKGARITYFGRLELTGKSLLLQGIV